jgi:hypothetical protein
LVFFISHICMGQRYDPLGECGTHLNSTNLQSA